jgi:hypothetical protein
MRRRYAFANAARALRNGKLRARVPETIAALAMWPTIGRPSALGPRRPAPDPVALPSDLEKWRPPYNLDGVVLVLGFLWSQ